MKKFFYSLVALLVSVSMCSCGTNPVSENQPVQEQAHIYTSSESRKFIIDTDTGADDASALILAAEQQNIEILGVTVLVGNVSLEKSTQNALAALEQAACDAPVYKGSADTIDGTSKIAFSVFGEDGMGDADLIHPQKQAENTDAIDFIIDTVKNNPDEVEIIALGPATNIAKAIDKAPDVMKNVKRIWSMGTAGLGPGNASPVAEFNVCADAKAYKIMLDSGLPITVVGLDVCDGAAMWTDSQFQKLESSGETGKFVAKSFGKIREFYKSNGSADVMNCDAMAMMCALFPDFIKSSIRTHASCITDEGETFAQVIYYKEGFQYDVIKNDFDYNVTLVTDADKSAYFENYKAAVSR